MDVRIAGSEDQGYSTISCLRFNIRTLYLQYPFYSQIVYKVPTRRASCTRHTPAPSPKLFLFVLNTSWLHP